MAIPLMLSLAHSLTAAEKDQSLDQLAVSVQYEALRDVAGTTYEESFYNADKSEEGLEANTFDVSGYTAPVSYFDYTSAEALAKEQLLAQLADGQGNNLSIIDTSFTDGIEGYAEVLISGGALIEEDGSFFENALWGETGGIDNNYFSGLSGFEDWTGRNTMASSSCQPYAQIQKIQARLKSGQSYSALNSTHGKTNKNNRLVNPNDPNNPSLAQNTQTPDLAVTELLSAVTTAQQSSGVETAIAKAPNLNECFIAQVKTVFNAEQMAIAPVKQMPNLTYYNYFFSTTETKANIENGSASYFLFRKSKPSDDQTEKRQQLFQAARQSVSKWSTF
jgi:hypothetical protein